MRIAKGDFLCLQTRADLIPLTPQHIDDGGGGGYTLYVSKIKVTRRA